MKVKNLIIAIILVIAVILGVFFLLKLQNMETLYVAGTVNLDANNVVEEKNKKFIQKKTQEFENKMEEYIDFIYFSLGEYITEFENINSASEQWLWECVYKNLVDYEEVFNEDIVTKEDIELAAKEIFGSDFEKEFPEKGIEFWLEPKEDGYFCAAASVEREFYNDFEILSYEKNNNEIIVNIVEYMHDSLESDEKLVVNLYKQNSDTIIKSYSINEILDMDEVNYRYLLEQTQYEVGEFVKENIELFSTATVTLEYDKFNDSFYIKSFER